MLKKNQLAIATTSLLALSSAAVWADDAAPAKPAGPTITDILTNSGVTATGYVDGTYSYFTYSGTGAPKDYNTFAFQQAGLTLASQPTSGFGALINVVAAPQSMYANNYLSYNDGHPSVQIFQGFVQYASGPWTIIGGKFATLAGAEVYAPPTNTNVTRSLLFGFEPLTHTGVRATYAVSDKLSLIVGANNGWWGSGIGGDETAAGSDKTLEAGLSFTPSKMVSWTLQGYYGRDLNSAGVKGNLAFVDTVVTVNVTSALSLVGSVDYGNQDHAFGDNTGSASWYGAAGYVNYAINDQWRVSVRGEYVKDQDGYLSGTTTATNFKEGTVTLGYDPAKNFELRLEGRYDKYGFSDIKTTQGWLEALFHF